MREIIAAMSVTLDGFIEGPNEELDWIDTWDDPYDDMFPHIDACVLGSGMYPGYEQYWLAILANPTGVLPLSGKVASAGEIAYAHFADRTPHFVLSKTLQKVDWKTTQVIRDIEDIRKMKQLPGKSMYAVGGAAFVSSLMNVGLVDEIRLVVYPVILGTGKPLFKDVKERHRLTLLKASQSKSGNVTLTYRTNV